MKKLCSVFFLLSCLHFSAQDYLKIPENKFQIQLNSPVEIIKKGEGHYFIDFGKAFFGTVQLRSNLTQNDSLTFHLGEKLTEPRTLDRNPGGSIRYQKGTLTNLEASKTITLQWPANKRNTGPAAIKLPESFGVIMPFRYFEIENLKIPIEELAISQKVFYYSFNDEASYFSSSDKVLDSIWNLCKHTIKATTFTGFYVDGDRERIPYEADAYINQLSHYSVDNEYSVARRTNQYFLDNPTWPTEWLLHTVLMFYYDYMYTGDLEILADYYDTLKIKTLIDLEREDGLISSFSENMTAELVTKLGFKKPDAKIKDIVDWPPGQKDTRWKLKNQAGERDGYELRPINTVVNSFYYRNLVLMASIAGFLDKTEDVVFWNSKAEKVKNTINVKLFDTERGVYIDGENTSHASLHANMFPLAFGLVSESDKKTVIDFIKSRGMACSVYGAQYLLEGLSNNGEAAYSKRLIADTSGDRTWWNMIRLGSTMTLEAWDPIYKPNLDWNHAWGAAPANIITRNLWGITPKTPGFKTAQIDPQIYRTDLTHSKIKVPTRNGFIYGTYKKSENRVEFQIKLEGDMKAIFKLPNTASKIKINTKRSKQNMLVLESGLNIIRFRY